MLKSFHDLSDAAQVFYSYKQLKDIPESGISLKFHEDVSMGEVEEN